MNEETPSLELWTVKEVAQRFNVSTQTVLSNEQVWGLVRVRTRTRSIWYRAADVIKAHKRLTMSVDGTR